MNDQFAFCKVAHAPVRIDTKDASEMVTQLLFGEVVELLSYSNQWIHIRSYMDGYEGWVDSKQLHKLSFKEVTRWLDGIHIEHSFSRTVLGPEGEFKIFKGSFRPVNNSKNFNIGKCNYVFLDDEDAKPLSYIEFAKSFLNTPYLWGGKSALGIDCSGFVQTVLRYFDIKFPRDASQQIDFGQEYDFHEKQPGDLVFFISENNKIHHVGIVCSENEIIHAHGYVRIDTLTQEGIVRKIDGVLSHKIAQINRVF